MARGVQNLRQVQQKFLRLGQQGQQAFRGAMYAEGLFITAKAVKKAPAVTGRLRNSHFVSWPDRKGKVVIGFGVIYARSVELGIRIVQMARRRQKAAWANIREAGWKKSKTGGPGFFRGAIGEAKIAQVARVAAKTKRFFVTNQGFRPSDKPRTAREGRAKANS